MHDQETLFRQSCLQQRQVGLLTHLLSRHGLLSCEPLASSGINTSKSGMCEYVDDVLDVFLYHFLEAFFFLLQFFFHIHTFHAPHGTWPWEIDMTRWGGRRMKKRQSTAWMWWFFVCVGGLSSIPKERAIAHALCSSPPPPCPHAHPWCANVPISQCSVTIFMLCMCLHSPTSFFFFFLLPLFPSPSPLLPFAFAFQPDQPWRMAYFIVLP